MQSIPEFDMRILADIADSASGRSKEELVQKHGFEILETVDFLLSNDLIKVHEHDIKPFLPPESDYKDPPKGNLIVTQTGKIELKRWLVKASLTKRERWKERLYGFISGMIVSVLSGLIISMFSK